MDISIVNRSTLATDAELLGYLPALQKQYDEDFLPFWPDGGPCKISFVGVGQPEITGTVPLYITDRSDVQGDLGYHEESGAVPDAKVFVQDCRLYSVPLSSVISHELLEMQGDPSARITRPGIDGRYYMQEACDPVSADLYNKEGVTVSNFVTPAYFLIRYNAPDQRYDFLRHLRAACPTLGYGGYNEGWDGTQWVQVRARLASGYHLHLSDRRGRSYWRATQGAPK